MKDGSDDLPSLQYGDDVPLFANVRREDVFDCRYTQCFTLGGGSLGASPLLASAGMIKTVNSWWSFRWVSSFHFKWVNSWKSVKWDGLRWAAANTLDT